MFLATDVPKIDRSFFCDDHANYFADHSVSILLYYYLPLLPLPSFYNNSINILAPFYYDPPSHHNSTTVLLILLLFLYVDYATNVTHAAVVCNHYCSLNHHY